MDDLISRADAIGAVGEWMRKEYGYLDLNRAERLIDALSELPSAEAVQGWIPCSERLPDESEFVLITIDIGTVTEAGTAMVEQVLTAHYSSADGEENLFQTIGYGNVFLSKEVTAWRPLPKPYRGRR